MNLNYKSLLKILGLQTWFDRVNTLETTVDSLSNAPAPTGDGNGIYGGSGTIPSGTKAQLLDNSTFLIGNKASLLGSISTALDGEFGLHIQEESINLFTRNIFSDHAYLNLYEFGFVELALKNTPGGTYQAVKVDAGEIEIFVGSGVNSRKIEITPTYIAINGGPRILTGTGSPEGVVSAPVSSHYHRTDGGAGTSFYVKEVGSGNTGWVAK